MGVKLYLLQVKYYGAEEFEVNRYKSAILDFQVCCVDIIVKGLCLHFISYFMLSI